MKLHSIQFLRGLAALTVVIYHIRALEVQAIARVGSQETALVGGFWVNGFAGVDLFFVISGFIMVYVTGRARPGVATMLEFLFSRASRIYPLWWLFASIMASYFWLAYGVPLDLQDATRRDQSPIWHLTASYLLLPQDNFPVLGVGWTLVHEMYFYVGFALLLLLPWTQRLYALIAWAGLVIVGSLAGLSAPFAGDLAKLAFYPMTLEFLLGAGVAVAAVNGIRPRPLFVTLLGGVLLALALQFHPDPVGTSQNGFLATLSWGRVLWFGIPATILVYGLSGLEITGRIRTPRFMVALGDWSFALYLSHMLTLSALARILPVIADIAEHRFGLARAWSDALRPGVPGLADNVVFLVAGVASSILVAGISYRVFEKRMLIVFGRLRARLFDRNGRALHPQPIRAAAW